MTARISVRGFAVASATAVTTVGAVVGVASGNQQIGAEPVELAASDATLLADIPVDGTTQVQTASLTQQVDAQTDAANDAAKKSAAESARKAAAKEAEAKKQAAEEARKVKEAAERAAKEREEARQAASRSTERTDFPQQSSYTIAEVKAMAQQIVGGGQYQCFSSIVERESGWNYQAQNPSSGAYGLVQALPGYKMASAGADWRTNPATQIKWGLNYMNERYGSPCGAWEFWQANHWY
ncbi:transglycosylase SLT domain-containing protein [Streptomyces sp. WMMC1477]|uniref:aggregation-promoting factor C-terminal-like domain-containing protein n=1 Tax=Streptomyces sp. WMMC1477 TaxID=3015155 RepID=UPI0022B644BE|nr:transglycosylase SLT domain-containing protein [Streptomyces sp. WMMC1477]MCZ7433425.1 transglycosylase SLT domain-containing protein [Streptomyces sp. WMMC1477]